MAAFGRARKRGLMVAGAAIAALATCVACGASPSDGASSPPATTSGTAGATGSAGSATSGAPQTSMSPSSATQSAADMLGSGETGQRGDVPWSEVGTGWFLVVDDSTAVPSGDAGETLPPSGVDTLWLVDPRGGKYSITTWPADTTDTHDVLARATLTDWSGDAKRALFITYTESITQVDLTTGVAVTNPVPNVDGAIYTTPTGANVVVSAQKVDASGATVGETFTRVELAANGQPPRQQTVLLDGDNSLAGPLYSPDGATLFAGDGDHLLAVSNAGGTPRQIAVAAGAEGCNPRSWWSDGDALVACGIGDGVRLWTVPVNGGAPTPLTAPPGGSIGLGYDNAVRLGSATYLQHPLGCGVEDIHKLGPGGVGTKLTVQGSLGNDRLVGAAGDRLAVESSTECEMPSWFGFVDPATGAASIILPGSQDHRGPGAAIAFRRDQ